MQHGADAKEARPLVQQLRSWCQVGAYAVCGVCGGLEARSLNEKDLRILPECTVECCQVCTAGQYVRPQRAHVPPQLRDLTLAQVEALSPLSLHQGDYSRASAGYGKFSRFTRLRWKASTFGERRAALPEELHEGVIAAYEFLMDNEDSAYKEFETLRSASSGEWAPYDFILERFVENAVWPDLYPYRTWCDSVFQGSRDWLSSKASFVAKAFSALPDYALEKRLAQFVYDRWLFSTVSSRFSMARRHGISLASALQDKTFTSDYLRNFRCMVVDVVRQIGLPRVFQTYAPAEWNFPLHNAVSAIVANVGAGDVFAAGGIVSMNIVHVMTQLIRGLLFGENGQKPWAWRSYIFADRERPRMHNVITFLVRMELQMGNHRESQGRAAWHWHVLSWHRSLRSTHLQHEVFACLPSSDAHLAYWAKEVQGSHEAFGKVELRPTHWNAKGNLVLHYPEDAVSRGLRPYLATMLLVTRGHSDVQIANDPAEAIEYLTAATRYSTKTAGSLASHALHRSATSWGAVKLVTSLHRPSEAELWALLTRRRACFLSFVGNATSPVIAPTLAFAESHELFQRYLLCGQRDDDTTFLVWCRTFNTSCEPARPWQRMRDRHAVALRYRNPLTFDFFDQILLTRVPCRSVREHLEFPECQMVPVHLQSFVALRCVFEMEEKPAIALWHEAGIRRFLQEECVSRILMQQCIAWWMAQNVYVDALLRREISVMDVPSVPKLLPEFSSSQRAVFLDIIRWLEERRTAREETEAPGHGIALLEGAPGTGKSTVIQHLLSWAQGAGLGVCLLASTGLLAESYRLQSCGALTDAGKGFGHMPTLDLAASVQGWDLVIVDEVFTLRREQVDHLLTAWAIGGRWPVILLCGDSQQIRPWNNDGSEAELLVHSRFWRGITKHELIAPFRQNVSEFELLQEVRSSFPSKRWMTRVVEPRLVVDGEPTLDDVRSLLQLHPASVFLAVSRGAVSWLNNLISEALFGDTPGWSVPTAEPEDIVTLHRGERLLLMQNIDKPRGLVNGKVCHLHQKRGDVLFVAIEGMGVVPVSLWSFDDRTCFPVLRGHALTIAKSMGATLSHVTLFMEEGMSAAAAGYVAITRVRRLKDLAFMGYPSARFFRPAPELM